VVLASTTVAAVIALRWTPEVTPGYHDLLWTVHTSLLLAGNAAIAWSIILLHELAHLVTARALGVPGRMSFGTRLQFLVAQTDVSGVWASPRWKRMTVYLSGIAVNIVVAATAILVRVAVGPHTPGGRVWAAVAVLSLLFIPPQLLLFMRTDLYFVLQDLTGCRNLYADGSAYVRWWGHGVRYAITRAGARPGDPGAAIPARERRALFGYALVLLLGTMVCLAVAVTVTLPVALSVLAMAAKGLFTDGHVQARIDALVTTAIVGGYWMLWCWAWWRRHGRRVGNWWGRVGTRAS
jgi:putative peptide zinc metalloprotease protein